MDDLARAMREADTRVNPTQASIRAGQHFIDFRHGPELPIFGEILDIKTLGVDEEEQAYLDEDYAQAHMRYYRPSRCFSIYCESGEVGDVHISEIDAIIDPQLFQTQYFLFINPHANNTRSPQGDCQ